MRKIESDVHPYMPNSAGRAQEEMLTEIGVKDIEELFEQIPPHHRLYSVNLNR